MIRTFALAILFLSSTVAFSQAPPAKRPIKHSDYDIWNTASGVALSPDGQWLAYSQTPPEGDGAIVVKSLTGNAAYTVATGTRAAVQVVPGATEAPAPPSPFGPLAGSPQFTPDGKRVLFPLLPTKAEQEKARAEKKDSRTVLAVMDLTNGKVVERIEKLKSFTVIEKTNCAAGIRPSFAVATPSKSG